MPICFAQVNEELTIKKVLVDDKTKRHFESLGIVPNNKITLVSVNAGNVIVIVKGVRLALNKDLASRILAA